MRSTGSRAAQLAFLLFIFAVAPDFLLQEFAGNLQVHRVPLNIDYLILAAVSVFLPTTVIGGVYVIILGLEVMTILATVFHSDLGTATASTTYVSQLNPWIVLPAGVFLVVFAVLLSHYLGVLYNDLRGPEKRRWIFGPVMGVALLLCGADVLNGTSRFFHREGAVTQNFLWSTGVNYYLTLVKPKNKDPREVYGTGLPVVKSAAMSFLPMAKLRDERSDVLLVIVESWGLFKNRGARDRVVAPYAELGEEYRVVSDSVRFYGATTAAEFRELCGLNLTHLLAPKYPLQQCLPYRLLDQGYETVAVHGFKSEFFNRNFWYRNVGFQRASFERELLRSGFITQCGSTIRGTCDSESSQAVAEVLNRPSAAKPVFVYWLTLNAHLPVLSSSVEGKVSGCKGDSQEVDTGDLCLLQEIWEQDARIITNIIKQHESTGRPLSVVVVGDHAPPFLDPSLRRVFSSLYVPAIYIERFSK